MNRVRAILDYLKDDVVDKETECDTESGKDIHSIAALLTIAYDFPSGPYRLGL